jgi:RNA polymerase sigma factor (sigma-70 family)
MTPRLLIEPARLAGTSLLRCQTDERLVDLVRAGNDRAFEAIVERYRRPLLRYCGRLLPPGRAEDAVQQAFLNAFSALHRDESRIDLRPWLYRIAHNASLNALRENGWSHEEIDRALAGHDSTHDAVERQATLRSVLQAVQTLPDRQRDAMILRELEGRSYEQIALELDSSDGAVRQLLNRARHSVRASATALTPWWAVRLPWASGGQVLERVSHAAAHDGVRTGVARGAGAVVATFAVVAGLAHVPEGMAPGPADRRGGDVRVGEGRGGGLLSASSAPARSAGLTTLSYVLPASSPTRPGRVASLSPSPAPLAISAPAEADRARGGRPVAGPRAIPTPRASLPAGPGIGVAGSYPRGGGGAAAPARRSAGAARMHRVEGGARGSGNPQRARGGEPAGKRRSSSSAAATTGGVRASREAQGIGGGRDTPRAAIASAGRLGRGGEKGGGGSKTSQGAGARGHGNAQSRKAVKGAAPARGTGQPAAGKGKR